VAKRPRRGFSAAREASSASLAKIPTTPGF
jgi:hypothetical protein